MARQGITWVAEYLASQGSNGDNAVAHVTRGETIIPKELVDKYDSNPKSTFEWLDIAYTFGGGVTVISIDINKR